MQIISGKAKGIKLKKLTGLNIRPTSSRVKESVFSILQDFFTDAIVLDIFAGTGNLGLEALSRGAKLAMFLDISSKSIKIIKENGIRSKMTSYMKIYQVDSLDGIKKLANKGYSFDIIFCDPPYNKGFVNKVLEKIDNTKLLTLKGILVFEHSHKERFKNFFNKISLKRSEKYGNTIISFFTRNNIDISEV